MTIPGRRHQMCRNIISSLEVWLCQNIGEENEMKANKAF